MRNRPALPWASGVRAAAVALLLGIVAAAGPADRALALVPASLPVFSAPLAVTNPFFPVSPGGVKVYSGREEGRTVTVVENHLAATRTFAWNGSEVACRIVETLEFQRGSLRDLSRGYYAQADDGTVYAFGETEDGPSPDDGPQEPNGWIVGRAAPTDPPGVVADVPGPAIVMPATPERGDRWHPTDVSDDFRETHEVLGTTRFRRRARAARGEALRVRERTAGESSGETIWFAPGTGPVRFQERGKRILLRASSVGEDR